MKRFALLIALAAPLLAGCKQPASAGASEAMAGFVHAGNDVAIKDVRTFATTDAVAYSSDEYYIIAFTFKNDLGYALAPRIDHFVLEDRENRRYLGADSGTAALIGIDNYEGLLKPGESHDYTVGFRVPQDTIGTLFYDATF